jgi:hypothetical protein
MDVTVLAGEISGMSVNESQSTGSNQAIRAMVKMLPLKFVDGYSRSEILRDFVVDVWKDMRYLLCSRVEGAYLAGEST